MKNRIKKFFVFISSAVMVFTMGTSVYASEEDNVQVGKTDEGYIYQANEKTVEYLEDVDGYFFENVTKDKVTEEFDKAFGVYGQNNLYVATEKEVSPEFIQKSKSVLNEKNVECFGVEPRNYRKSYTLNSSMKGPAGQNIRVYWVVEMNMTTVTHQGKEYAMFVSFSAKSNFSLETNSYVQASGTGSPVYSITNSGATMSVRQMIQLETANTVSADLSVGFEWVQISAGTGSSVYLRSKTTLCSASVTLPIINIIM